MKMLVALHWEDLAKFYASGFPQYEVHICHDGATALSLLDSIKPDIFIAGPSFVDMDILTLLQHCNHKPRAIIVFTNVTADLALLQDMRLAGVHRIIPIPCTLYHVKEQINELLNKSPSPA